MMPKTTTKGLALLAATLLLSANAWAQSTSSGKGISAGEILLYVAIIVGVCVLAWFLSVGQDGKDKKGDAPTTHHPKQHYDHPNDPHFRKLRKKTS